VAGTYRVPDVSLDFYLGRSLSRESDASALAARVGNDPGRLWVVRADDVDTMAERLPFSVERVLTVSRRTVVRLAPFATGERKSGS
jgi:hypothetical protein